MAFDIQKNLKLLPDKPGVYLHRDALGHVIYVGKAVNLKNRVRQYFQSQTNMAPKVRAMVSHIEEFEYITTDSEYEALILECNLIKKYQPKYNVLLRDDKTYPYIKVTLGEDYPRVLKTRRVVNDGAQYFGPYSDVGAVNEIIDLLNSVYTLKRCSAKAFPKGFRPCLNYHINQCRGICTGQISKKDYKSLIDDVLDFLRGRDNNLLNTLTDAMQKESAALNFEKAAEYRDKINAIKAINERQKVVLGSANDMDIIVTAHGRTGYHIVLFYVRGGKLSGRETMHMDVEDDFTGFTEDLEAASLTDDSDDTAKANETAESQTTTHAAAAAVIGAFIKQYYTRDMLIPKEIAVEYMPEEGELLSEWLSSMRGAGVHLYVPQRGDKHQLLQMARRDVVEMTKSLDDRAAVKAERVSAVAAELNRTFGQRDSWRIESYDISNTMGVDSVGGMVVFEDGKPQRKSYRKFKIKTVDGPDDYTSMQEVIYRRFRRAQQGDAGFLPRPDIIFVDGGLGHVHAVMEVLDAMDEDVLVAGMVKDDRHRTRGLIVNEQELDLRKNPVLFRYVTTIQDEVHRFAIDYHRGLQNKNMSRSILDDAPGIGSKRKQALISRFGSIENMRNATVEELADTDGMTTTAAESLKAYLEDKKKS